MQRNFYSADDPLSDLPRVVPKPDGKWAKPHKARFELSGSLLVWLGLGALGWLILGSLMASAVTDASNGFSDMIAHRGNFSPLAQQLMQEDAKR